MDDPLTADYVLEYRNTKLATVEAKAWDQAFTAGVGKTKDYAKKLAIRKITVQIMVPLRILILLITQPAHRTTGIVQLRFL